MKKLLLALAVSAVLLAQSPQHYPHASYSITEYAPPSTVTPAILNWIAARFDWIVGATTPADPHGSFGSRVHVQAYTDSAVVYQGQMYDVQALAISKVWSLEDMMLHSNQDVAYNVAGGYQKWTAMHQFDAFEQVNTSPNPGLYTSAINGVLLFDGQNYTDVTVSSFAGAPGVGGQPGSVNIPGMLLVGYMEPFDQMNFTVATGRAGGSVLYQYWNGSSWAQLVNLSDSTNGLVNSGKVQWWPPADWTQTTVNGSKLKYWVRIAAGTPWATAPVYSALYGDDWSIASPGNNARGWAATFNSTTGTWADAAPPCPNNTPDGTSCVINPGTRLRYNSNPPAGASAHFRYQSRVSDIYYANPNEMFGNPSNVQGGRITWGDWLNQAWQTQAAVYGSYYDATFFDDVSGIPTVGAAIASPANFQSGLDFDQRQSFPAIVATELAQVKASLRGSKGPAFMVGINGGTSYPAPFVADTSQQEGYGVTTWVPYPVYEDASGSNQTYLKFDDMLPPGQPQFFGAGFANGLNDLTWSGTYSGPPSILCLKITGNSPETFSLGAAQNFSALGTCSSLSSGNVITGSAQSIGSGLTVSFKASSGHTVGDMWYWQTQSRNANNANGQFTCWDSAQFWGPGLNASKWHYVDLANRTPMLCLGQYYLGWNQNTGMYYTTYTYGNLDEVYTYAAPTSLTAALSPGATSLQLSSAAGCLPLPVYGGLVGVRIGTTTSGDTVFGGLSGNGLTVYVGQVGNSWAPGASAQCIVQQHQSAIPVPPVASVYRWASWFPAMAVDLGLPDASGLNHGYRMGPEIAWIKASTFSPNSQVTDLWRRDFTNGVVLMRGWAYPGSWNEIELDNPPSSFPGGHPVCIQGSWPKCTGGPWYRLAADGTTGPASLSVDLREAEVAILLKAPVGQVNPGGPRGLRVRGGVIR